MVGGRPAVRMAAGVEQDASWQEPHMVVTLRGVAAQRAQSHRDQVARIYRDAFRGPPYCKGEAEVADFEQSFPRHVKEEGFRMVAAWQDQMEPMVGFCYGTASTPDQWWFREVEKAVPDWVVTAEDIADAVGYMMQDRVLKRYIVPDDGD